MQSWGHDSSFGRRDSLDFPTKSGVLGIICCALGAKGEQREWLSKWAEENMTVHAFSRVDYKGEAVMREPMLTDFHMVGSGYDDKNPWESLFIPKMINGKKANSSGGKLTYRYYIQDMAYAVILTGTSEMIDEVREALLNPVWDLYLGRKNCAPTEFIYQGEFSNDYDAYETALKISKEKNRGLLFSVLQGVHEGEVLCLNDVPVQFGNFKRYCDRQVTVVQAGRHDY